MNGVRGLFRLWCKNRNEWERDEWVVARNGVVCDARSLRPLNSETHILTRHTGEVDTHCIDIWEGDIIKCNISMDINFDYYEDRCGVVKYAEGCFYIEFEKYRDICFCELPHDAEVIGNIFENPDWNERDK